MAFSVYDLCVRVWFVALLCVVLCSERTRDRNGPNNTRKYVFNVAAVKAFFYVYCITISVSGLFCKWFIAHSEIMLAAYIL